MAPNVLQPDRTSLLPNRHQIAEQLEDGSVRAAFLKVTEPGSEGKFGGRGITAREVDMIERAGARDNPLIRGHAVLAREVGDFRTIANYGRFFADNATVVGKMDALAEKYEKLPTVSYSATDPGSISKPFEHAQTGVNKVSFRGRTAGDICPDGARCIIGGPSVIRMQVGNHVAQINPRPRESAASIAKRLVARFDQAGVEAKVRRERGGVYSVEVVKVPDANTGFKNLTQGEPDFGFYETQDGQVGVSVGRGGPINVEGGGTVGFSFGGIDFAVATKAGEGISEVLQNLRAEVAGKGYKVDVTPRQGIDSIEQLWDVRKVDSFKPFTYGTLEGKIVNDDELGAAKPRTFGMDTSGGRWLLLDQPRTIGDQEYKAVYLGYKESDLQSGDQVTLHGRMDNIEGPLEIFPNWFAGLSGISNLDKDEPKYNGREFLSSVVEKGPLSQLFYNIPNLMDAPSILYVPDHTNDTVHVGAYGGMPFAQGQGEVFHGFRRSAELKLVDSFPNNFDTDVTWQRGQPAYKGVPMTAVSKPDDSMRKGEAYYLDAESGQLFMFTGRFPVGQNDQATLTHVAEVGSRF